MESFELASSTHQDTEAWRSTALKNLDEQIASETRQHPREKLQAKRDGIANATPDQIAAHLQRRHDEAITRRLDRWADWTEDSVRYRDCSFDSFRITHDKQAVVIGKLRDFAQNLAANIDAGKNLVLAGNCGTGKDHLLFALARHAMVTLGLTTRIRLLTGAQLIAKKCADFQGLACHGVGEILALSDPVLPGEQARFSALAALYQIVDERYRRRWPVWVTVNASCRDEMLAMLSAPVADRLIDDALVLHCDWPSHRKPA